MSLVVLPVPIALQPWTKKMSLVVLLNQMTKRISLVCLLSLSLFNRLLLTLAPRTMKNTNLVVQTRLKLLYNTRPTRPTKRILRFSSAYAATVALVTLVSEKTVTPRAPLLLNNHPPSVLVQPKSPITPAIPKIASVIPYSYPVLNPLSVFNPLGVLDPLSVYLITPARLRHFLL